MFSKLSKAATNAPTAVAKEKLRRDSMFLMLFKARGANETQMKTIRDVVESFTEPTTAFLQFLNLMVNTMSNYPNLSDKGRLSSSPSDASDFQQLTEANTEKVGVYNAMAIFSKRSKAEIIVTPTVEGNWVMSSDAGKVLLATPFYHVAETKLAKSVLLAPFSRDFNCNFDLILAGAENHFGTGPAAQLAYKGLYYRANKKLVYPLIDCYEAKNEASSRIKALLTREGYYSDSRSPRVVQDELVTRESFIDGMIEVYDANSVISFKMLQAAQNAFMAMVEAGSDDQHFLNTFSLETFFGNKTPILALGNCFTKLKADRVIPDASKFTTLPLPHMVSVCLKQDVAALHNFGTEDFSSVGSTGYYLTFRNPSCKDLYDIVPKPGASYFDLKSSDCPVNTDNVLSDVQFTKTDVKIMHEIYGGLEKTSAKGGTFEAHTFAGDFMQSESVRRNLMARHPSKSVIAHKMKLLSYGSHHEDVFENYLKSFTGLTVRFSVVGSRPHNGEVQMGFEEDECFQEHSTAKNTAKHIALMRSIHTLFIFRAVVYSGLVRSALEVGGSDYLSLLRGHAGDLRHEDSLLNRPPGEDEEVERNGLYDPLEEPFELGLGNVYIDEDLSDLLVARGSKSKIPRMRGMVSVDQQERETLPPDEEEKQGDRAEEEAIALKKMMLTRESAKKKKQFDDEEEEADPMDSWDATMPVKLPKSAVTASTTPQSSQTSETLAAEAAAAAAAELEQESILEAQKEAEKLVKLQNMRRNKKKTVVATPAGPAVEENEKDAE